MFKLIFSLLGLALLAGVILYLAPDNIKEKVLSYINSSPYVPASIKQETENLYATPSMKRQKLIDELNKSLGDLQNYVEKTATSPAAAQTAVGLITRSKDLVSQVIKQNSDPTVIKQITDAVTTKILNSGASCTTATK